MIKVIQGDVTKATENIIVHQVNCQGKMASGVAKSIRKVFPKAYQEYMSLWEKQEDTAQLLGHAQVVPIGDTWQPNKFIVNLFGQEFYGYDGQRYTSYDALYDGLMFVKKKAQEVGLSVAMPFGIGCARGGADWRIVKNIIEVIFQDYEVTLYHYEGK